MATSSTPEQNQDSIGVVPIEDYPADLRRALEALNPTQARRGFASLAHVGPVAPAFTVLQAPGFDEHGREVVR